MKSEMVLSGDIMTAHPATYYHYEPLLHYDITQARSGAKADDAVRTLKDLMHCNYTSLGKEQLLSCYEQTTQSIWNSFLRVSLSHIFLQFHRNIS